MNDNILKEILKESYKIQLNKITKNSDSTDGNVYLIESENSKYIFKIYDNFEHTLKLYQQKIKNIIKNMMIIIL